MYFVGARVFPNPTTDVIYVRILTSDLVEQPRLHIFAFLAPRFEAVRSAFDTSRVLQSSCE